MHAYSKLSIEDQVQPFSSFMSFLEQERSVAMRLAERQSSQKANGNVRKTVFYSSINAGSSDHASQPSNCVIYTKNGVKHKTEDCRIFLIMPLDERIEKLRKNKSCLVCLGSHMRGQFKKDRCM